MSTWIPKIKVKKVPMVNNLSWVLTMSSLKTFLVRICNICLLILRRFRPLTFWGLIIICVPSAIFLKTYFLILWDGSINHKYIVNCSLHFMRNSLSFDLRITCLSMTKRTRFIMWQTQVIDCEISLPNKYTLQVKNCMRWSHLRVPRKRSETSKSNHLIFAIPKLNSLSRLL